MTNVTDTDVNDIIMFTLLRQYCQFYYNTQMLVLVNICSSCRDNVSTHTTIPTKSLNRGLKNLESILYAK